MHSDLEFRFKDDKEPVVCKDATIRFGHCDCGGVKTFYVFKKNTHGYIQVEANENLDYLEGYQLTMQDVRREFCGEVRKFFKIVASSIKYKWHKVKDRKFKQ